MKIAIYPGSFDPPTNGHLAIIEQALLVFDRLVVAVGCHPGKKPLFDFAVRKAMLKAALDGAGFGQEVVEISAFEGLTVSAAREQGARFMVRGIRDATDFDYEMQLASTNRLLDSHIETVFLPARAEVRGLSATLVRQIWGMGGDVSRFVPEAVLDIMHTEGGERS